MSNEPVKQKQISSPCIRQCTLNPEDICLGCYRNMNEICGWSKMSDIQRTDVLLMAADRKSQNNKTL
jgi:predicted Fe-S protein YdhL (DUF1289 family)